MGEMRTGRPDPILDHGVTLDRGDHVIVLLDATPGDDVQREIEAICAMLAGGAKQECNE